MINFNSMNKSFNLLVYFLTIINAIILINPTQAHLGRCLWRDPIFNVCRSREGHSHIPTPPQETPEPLQPPGRDLFFINGCRKPVRLLVRHQKYLGDDWITRGWWSVDGNESTYLNSSGRKIRLTNKIVYYYARSTDRSSLWTGDEDKRFGNKTYPMREETLSVNGAEDYVLKITCR